MSSPIVETNPKASENSYPFQGVVLMMLVTLIWSSMPVLIKEVISTVSPPVQITIRFLLATVVFLPFVRNLNLGLLRDGAITGLLFFGAVATETIALQTIPANQASFIYGLLVIFITIFELVFYRRQSLTTLLAALIAFIGIGIMSYQNGLPPIGEVWMLLCALFASGWIFSLELIGLKHPPLPLTLVQLCIITLLSLLWTGSELIGNFDAIIESLKNPKNLAILLYLGIIATGVNIWLQAKALKMVTAFEVGIMETLEPIFGAILAFLLLGETFTTNGYIGAAVVIVGITIALNAKNARLKSELTLPADEKSASDIQEVVK